MAGFGDAVTRVRPYWMKSPAQLYGVIYLNPVRMRVAVTPGESDRTSIQQRL